MKRALYHGPADAWSEGVGKRLADPTSARSARPSTCVPCATRRTPSLLLAWILMLTAVFKLAGAQPDEGDAPQFDNTIARSGLGSAEATPPGQATAVSGAQEVAPPSRSDTRPSVPGAYDHQFMLRSADGVYGLKVSGLGQFQYAHTWPDGASSNYAFLVNRGRVGLSGTAFTRNLRYALEADFGRGDIKLVAYFADYTFVPGVVGLRVGQFKRPFSRPALTAASRLSMIDLPMTSDPDTFGDRPDVGVMLHNGSEAFEYAVAAFNGSGAGPFSGVKALVAGEQAGGEEMVAITGDSSSNVPDRSHPLLAARVGYNTGGLVAYSEGDLEGGAARLGVAVAGIADFDKDDDDGSFISGQVDMMLKAYGYALTSAFYVGTRQNGARWSDQQLYAIGHYTQMGYVIAGHFEPVLRYSFLMSNGMKDDRHDLAAGLNVYLHEHALKLQSIVSIRLHSRDGEILLGMGFKSQLSLAF